MRLLNAAFWELVEHIFVFIITIHHHAVIEDEGPPWNITHWFAHSFDIRERGGVESRRDTDDLRPCSSAYKLKLCGYTSCRCFAAFLQHVSLGRVSSTVQVLLFYAAAVFPETKLPNYLRHAVEPLSRRPCCQVRIPWGRGTSGYLWACGNWK